MRHCYDCSIDIANCYTYLICATHNVSNAVLSCLLQLFFVVLGNLLVIQNLTL